MKNIMHVCWHKSIYQQEFITKKAKCPEMKIYLALKNVNLAKYIATITNNLVIVLFTKLRTFFGFLLFGSKRYVSSTIIMNEN